MSFWERIKQLCAEHHTTPTALCKSLGLSTSMVTRWKRGTLPNNSTLKMLAKALDVTPHELMWGGKLELDLQLFAESAPEQEKEPSVTLSPKLEALIDGMTEEELADLERYAEFIMSRKKG